MTQGSTTLATETAPRGPDRPRRLATRLGLVLATTLLATAALAAASPADLRSILDKTDNALSQADKAARSGRDPGKVSLLLQRVDELGDELRLDRELLHAAILRIAVAPVSR